MAGPATLFLHIGLHKTGTTFLQNLFQANGAQLAEQGVDYPHTSGDPSQTHAVWDLHGRRPRGVKDRRIAGTWQELVERVNRSALPTALLSEERLSVSTLKQASRVTDQFGGSDVHVIVTVRDLARVAVSSWQEEVKSESTQTWQRYFDSITDPSRSAVNPARGFWMRQDLLQVCETWEAALAAGPDHIHLVTVPPSGADPDMLLHRFASVVGFDATKLTANPRGNNESVGVAGVEVIRRINERLGGRLNQAQYVWVVKRTMVRMLAEGAETVRFGLPAEDIPWAAERAETWIGAIEDHRYDVVGDLDDLLPRSNEGIRRPDEVSEGELLEASLAALSMLSEDYASKLWARRSKRLEAADNKQASSSQARALVYKCQRAAAGLLDRTVVGAKLMALVLRSRERAVNRARTKQP